MEITLVYHGQAYTLPGPLTVREAIELAGLDPRQLSAIREGEILLWDAILEGGDRVDLVDIVMGG